MLRKAVLTRDCSKKHIKQNWCKRDSTTRKTDCPFDAVAVLEDKSWKSCFCKMKNHNDEPILAGAHSTHRKAARNGEVLEQIAIHARTRASTPQNTHSFTSIGSCMMREIRFLKVRAFTVKDNVFERLGLMD